MNTDLKQVTDRELIERAARAAGVDVGWGHFGFGQEWLTPDHILGGLRPWRPLADDGDALRLAVKLGLNIDVYRRDPLWEPSGVEVRGYVYRRSLALEPATDNGASLESATRRAIVRAAATMAKEG
jgi:hypothetical protein